MHLLFLDGSGRIDRAGMFALGGIAVRDTDRPHLRDAWQETLRAHGWPLDRELKWHGIRAGNVPPALADAIFDALAATRCTAYVTLLDLDAPPGRRLHRLGGARRRDRPQLPEAVPGSRAERAWPELARLDVG